MKVPSTARRLYRHLPLHPEPAQSALDKQVGGDHYKKYAIQPIEFITKNNIPFIEGNIIKYIVRWRDKGGVETLEKIKHYVDMLIEDHNERTKS